MRQSKKIIYFGISFLIVNFPGFAQNVYQEALKQYYSGHLKTAIELFTQSINNKEEVSNSYMMRGSAKGMLKDLFYAIDDLDSAKLIDSTNKKLFFYYGRTYSFSGSFYMAIKYYNMAIVRDSSNAAIYDDRAISKAMIKDYLGAIEDETWAIQKDSLVSVYFLNRGFAKSEAGFCKEAVKDFNRSILLQPEDNIKAYADRGSAYAKLNEHSNAIKDFTKVIEIVPTAKDAYYLRGLSYIALKKNGQACLDFEKSSELGYEAALLQKERHCGHLKKEK